MKPAIEVFDDRLSNMVGAIRCNADRFNNRPTFSHIGGHCRHRVSDLASDGEPTFFLARFESADVEHRAGKPKCKCL